MILWLVFPKNEDSCFEGDEYLTSPIDLRSKFHLYHPNVALVTGIKLGIILMFSQLLRYMWNTQKNLQICRAQGTFIYFEQDKELQKIARGVRPDITALAYNTPEYVISEGKTYIKYNSKEISLQVFGEHNLQKYKCCSFGLFASGMVNLIFTKLSVRLWCCLSIAKITEANGCTAF